MSSPPFRFKQFSVAHDKCAMKVNTDGVLLGAWADVDEARTILDIGTGTGVIALMMAQRTIGAFIYAIDIDKDACIQAGENFSKTDSEWCIRLSIECIALQDYFPDQKFDLIISNPPYFIDDYKAENHQKNIAKHSIALSYQDLISGISRLIADNGIASIVLPVFNLELFESLALAHGLFVVKLTEVVAVEGKQPYLALIKLAKQKQNYSKDTFTIQNEDGIFTGEYKSLTKDFYLKF